MSEETVNEELESNAEEQKIKKVSTRITDKDSILTLFPLRLGLFTGIFIAFFFITAIFLYISQIFISGSSGFDLFQIFLSILRIPTLIFPINLFYSILIPIRLVNQAGLEAIYISTSLILSFFTISLLCSIDSVRHLIFRQTRFKSTLTQIGLFILLFSVFLHVFDLIYGLYGYTLNGLMMVNYISISIIVIAEIAWLFIQTWSLLSFARKFATDAEGYVSSHESKLMYGLVRLAPILCMFGVIAFSLALYFLVGYGTIFGFIEGQTLNFFTLLIMIIVSLLCFIPFLITLRTKKENRRKRAYDSFVYSVTNLSIYPYLYLNLVLFFLLYATGGASGALGDLGEILVLVELFFVIFSMVYSLRRVGINLDYEALIFEKEGFILAIYAAIMGQFALRYFLLRNQLTFILGSAAFLEIIVNSGTAIIVVGVLLSLIISLFLMGTKKFASTFKLHRKISKEDEKRIAAIYDFLKQEYIRRGMVEFPVFDILNNLRGIFQLDENRLARLINLADKKHEDLKIEGLKKRYVYFLKDMAKYVSIYEEPSKEAA
ncbi:MAG: hypothetical protein ACTSRW_09285 [Candidatus Helarchaeota archaeon]